MEDLQDILRPSLKKLCLAIALAVCVHVLVVSEVVRETGTQNVSGVVGFWTTNLHDALPYLETDNVFLKFITFFIGAYALVWVGSVLFRVLDRGQVALTQRLRRIK